MLWKRFVPRITVGRNESFALLNHALAKITSCRINVTQRIQTQLHSSRFFLARKTCPHPGVGAYRLSVLTEMFEKSLARHAAILTAPSLSPHCTCRLRKTSRDDIRSLFTADAAGRHICTGLFAQYFRSGLNSTVHSDTYCSVRQHLVLWNARSHVLCTFCHWFPSFHHVWERKEREEWDYYGGLLMSAVASLPVKSLIYTTRLGFFFSWLPPGIVA